MVTAFCRQLGWKNMEMLISQFQDRLHFGIHSELLELMKLPSLNGIRARTLFDSGFESISSIASADIHTIENILHKSVPFQSEKAREDDDNDDIRKRNKMKSVWITGYCGITIKEAAENLISEARKHLSLEIGVVDINWNNKLTEKTEALGKLSTDTMNCESQKIMSENKTQSKIGLAGIVQNISFDKIEKLETFDTETRKTKHETENTTFQKNPSQSMLAKSTKEKERKDNYLFNHKIDLKHLNKPNLTCAVNEKEKDTNLPDNTLHNGFNVNNSEINCPMLGTKESQFQKLEQVNCNIAKKDNDKSIDNTVLTAKESILWDSLNFTENGLENITKLRTSDKMSPNVSFGEFEKSIAASNISETMNSSKQNISTKDISLFSSEGDSSSLFEESLPIDLISSNLFDKESNILRKQETTSDYASIDSNTLLNAFKTTLIEVEDSEEDDIKLVYEDDVISENELPKTTNIAEFNVIIDKNNISYKRSYNLSKQTEPLFKKKKTDDEFVLTNIKETSKAISSSLNIHTKNPLSKRLTMDFNKYELNCYVLRGNDIINNIHVIEDVQIASIYFTLNQCIGISNEIIGSEVIDNAKYRTATSLNENSPVKGISIFFNKDICIYLDFTAMDDILEMKHRLKCWFKKKVLFKVLCSKTVNMKLKQWLGVNLPSNCTDISLFEWLIDSTEKIPDIEYLTKKYCGINFSNWSLKIDGQQKRFKGLDIVETQCIRTFYIWMIAEKQEKVILENFYPLQNIVDTESQVSKILANSEYYGITTDKDLASRLLIDVRNSQDILQKKAYKLCGYHFNFNSSKDVAKALGIYNGRKVSTKKSVLTSHNSPLSSIVIYWRKLNSILTKTLYPLTEKACIYTEGNRINPSYTMFTCTGRISMHEPNLQNVPRTFSIPSEYLTLNKAKCDEVVEFNCRNIFKAAPGYIIVSADYCQLEMRILTHFSKDPVLMDIMNSDVDVFKSIAALWSNVAEDEVDDDLRQKAKQLCYGIIYGMGNRTLGQHLDVTEMEAAIFMDSFYKTYPAVKMYSQSVVEECRKKGYVETLAQRRRYLPDIRSSVTAKKSAAERQAVNTTIQGSAADIAKAAMCSIDTNTDSLVPKPRLILQMHDELVYEVPQYYKQTFVAIMKKVMEESVKLTVPLPVKVKCGYSWGSLTEMKLY
ncbi:unnamed protein product [Arctia plantaginis]|uniref:DNA-directed DNA polymerase n=1 Tax=Arctia plantaginis TaxID=874455 RepID=A0A8S1A3P9_ARCPL|nr:unnamed protein product [Arctia plantaginis]